MEMIIESQANEAVTVTPQLPTDTSRKASGNCHYNHIACILFLLMMSHGMLTVKHRRQAHKEKCSILSVNLLVTKTCTLYLGALLQAVESPDTRFVSVYHTTCEDII